MTTRYRPGAALRSFVSCRDRFRSGDDSPRAFLERYLGKVEPSPAVLWLGVRVENALGDAAAASKYGDQLKRDFAESVETRLLLEQERNAG